MRRGAAAACVLAALPGVGGRFLGFHLDDERCTGPDSRFGNRSTLVPPCLAVLKEYAFFVGNLSGTGLTLAVDSGACVAPTCYNVTWNGVSKRGHEHVRAGAEASLDSGNERSDLRRHQRPAAAKMLGHPQAHLPDHRRAPLP